MTHLRKWSPFFIVATLVIALDQISKQWVIDNMAYGETVAPLPALQPFFQFTRSSNTGIAFGIGSGGSEIFLLLSVIITGVLVFVYARSQPGLLLQHIGLSMVIGGAIGNVVDRLQHGHVVDFIHYVIPGLISNVSNLADHAIVIGVFLLLVDSFLQERRHKQQDETTTVLTDAPTS